MALFKFGGPTKIHPTIKLKLKSPPNKPRIWYICTHAIHLHKSFPIQAYHTLHMVKSATFVPTYNCLFYFTQYSHSCLFYFTVYC